MTAVSQPGQSSCRNTISAGPDQKTTGLVPGQKTKPTGRLVLQEPSYKPNWEIPGGAVEADESPWATASRELVEELGLDRPLGRLLVVGYVRPQDSGRSAWCSSSTAASSTRPTWSAWCSPTGGIGSARFHTIEQATPKVKPLLADRLAVAVEAARQGVTALCEHGVRIARTRLSPRPRPAPPERPVCPRITR